jgi:hypothetical protein
MTLQPPSSRRFKVVQWATGNIGTRSLRAVIEHPCLDLVGVYVHTPAKARRDAGELCGLAPIGVKATDSIDEILALGADCILYMQQGANIDDLCRLLAGGCNVVTTRVEFLNPATLDPAVRSRLEDACHRGGSSLHSTGSSPGFSTEALPVVLLSLQRRLDRLTINEFGDVSSRNSPELLFNIMYSVEVHGEFANVRNRTRIAAGVLEAGTVGAQRITVAGMRDGKPLMQMCLNHYCSTDIDQPWDLRESGWHILVEGDTPLDVSIRFPIAIEHYAAMTPGLTAHRAVNAAPYVCAAAPGIRTTAELPQVIPRLG